MLVLFNFYHRRGAKFCFSYHMYYIYTLSFRLFSSIGLLNLCLFSFLPFIEIEYSKRAQHVTLCSKLSMCLITKSDQWTLIEKRTQQDWIFLIPSFHAHQGWSRVTIVDLPGPFYFDIPPFSTNSLINLFLSLFLLLSSIVGTCRCQIFSA